MGEIITTTEWEHLMSELHIEDNPMPLDGIRVLELGNYIAAPFASRIFGDCGADVRDVRPATGRFLR